MSHLDLAIIIVSWNVRELVRACITSVEASLANKDIRYRIVVVDNASHDGTPQMLHSQFPHVVLLANKDNRGWAKANNDGLRALGLLEPTAFGEHEQQSEDGTSLFQPTYVLLLNPDTEVVADALPQLVHYLDTHPLAIVAGPQLRYGDGTEQSSRRRFPSIGALFWESTLLEQWWPDNRWVKHYHMKDQPATHEQPVEWLVGAALMVRGTAILSGGGLDEGFFMYSEEVEWQERLVRTWQDSAAQIVFLPSATIMHYEGRSSEQNLQQRHINFNRSKLRYARLRYGRLIAYSLRTFLLTTYLLQAIIEGSKWILGHKRPLRASRVRQFLGVVTSGL